MSDNIAWFASHVIARNNVTKQSRSRKSVSEIAAVASLPRNDAEEKIHKPFSQMPIRSQTFIEQRG
jgi:hypothetical protein